MDSCIRVGRLDNSQLPLVRTVRSPGDALILHVTMTFKLVADIEQRLKTITWLHADDALGLFPVQEV